MDYREIAKKYIENGYSVIPVNSTKEPSLAKWGLFQIDLMSNSEIEKHFKDTWGIALLCGGGWRVVGLDFDLKYDLSGTLFDRFKKLIPKKLLEKMYVQTTKNAGYHFVFKVPESRLAGNQKLASRETTAYERDQTYRDAFNDPKTRDKATRIAHNDKSRVLIETRSSQNISAAGGYVVISPTPGYTKLYGKIQEITEEEYDLLMEAARSFNEVIDYNDYHDKEAFAGSWEITPIDHYNESGDVVQCLVDNGWDIVPSHSKSKNVRFKRPGHTHNTSSALFDTERRAFTCFSSSVEFDINKGYSPFGIYAMLEHENDFNNAFKQLVLEGYGTR